MSRQLKLEISRGPKCPHCQCEGFDDWHLTKGLKASSPLVIIYGALKCHGCGKFFHVDHYNDGMTHSSAWTRQATITAVDMIDGKTLKPVDQDGEA